MTNVLALLLSIWFWKRLIFDLILGLLQRFQIFHWSSSTSYLRLSWLDRLRESQVLAQPLNSVVSHYFRVYVLLLVLESLQNGALLWILSQHCLDGLLMPLVLGKGTPCTQSLIHIIFDFAIVIVSNSTACSLMASIWLLALLLIRISIPTRVSCSTLRVISLRSHMLERQGRT